MGLKVFAGSSSRDLTQAICKHLKAPLGKAQTVKFSEGNIFVRIRENVRGEDTFVVQTTSDPVNDNFMELLFWIDALKRASAAQVTAVAFLGSTAIAVIRDVLRDEEITDDTIYGSICGYLLVGVTWALVYDLVLTISRARWRSRRSSRSGVR